MGAMLVQAVLLPAKLCSVFTLLSFATVWAIVGMLLKT